MNDTRIPILIVDDVPQNVLILQKMLATPERDIVTAYSGAAALELLHQGEYALVLLDIEMPEVDGYAVAEGMRQTNYNRETPIIFVTAFDNSTPHVTRGYSVGAVDFIPKPVNSFLVRCKVQVFCELYRQRQLTRRQLAEIQQQNEELNRQMLEIKTLRGLLPICANCKRVRNDGGYWEGIEQYLMTHTEAMLSHCLCSECIQKLYPDISPEPEKGAGAS